MFEHLEGTEFERVISRWVKDHGYLTGVRSGRTLLGNAIRDINAILTALNDALGNIKAQEMKIIELEAANVKEAVKILEELWKKAEEASDD